VPVFDGRKGGVTDAQIADALGQNLPHLSDPVSLQDRRVCNQCEGTGITEKDNQPLVQKKRTHTTSQAMKTQPLLFTTDVFVATLGSIHKFIRKGAKAM
jgi:hypothetical protein